MKHTDYTLGDGSLDIVRMYQLFNQGATVALAFLDTVVPSLTMLCRSLESEFSCPFQTNVYMTPPGAQGAEPHDDTHDVFVLQVSGSKHRTIFGTPVESPLPDQSFDAKVHELGARTLEFELQPGDVAFIPAGVAHEARSTDTVSLHITVGVLRYTWADFLTRLVTAESCNNPAWRKSLPHGFARSGFDRTQFKEAFRSLLQQTSFESSFDGALDSFMERLFARSLPVLQGQMEQLASLDSLNIESLVGARQGVLSRVTTDCSSVSIDTYGRTITLPSYAEDPVRFALSHGRFFVKDLPGNLDDAGKLTVIRRLIREGLDGGPSSMRRGLGPSRLWSSKIMRIPFSKVLAFAALLVAAAHLPARQAAPPQGAGPQGAAPRHEDTEIWAPEPKVVTPGVNNTAPPSDAIVLFDGKNLDEWVTNRDKSPAKWTVSDGVLTVNKDKDSGNIETKRTFKNYQLHVEWKIPENITGTSQARGNSGVFLASTGPGDAGYELQVLDSYNNKTYVNGQAGSIYKQSIPLANPNRKPGEWQTYDVIWTAPTFNADGSVKTPAYVTVLFNGVLVQNHYQLQGETLYIGKPFYRPYDRAPIKLQAHGDKSEPDSFRNIWIRELD